MILDPPLRLRARGRYLKTMDWPFFLASLAQRMEMLAVIFHTGGPLGRERWVHLKERLLQLAPAGAAGFVWKDWNRYSNRQRRNVPMGGLAGETVIPQAPPELWEWLRCAPLVHAGKGAVMGLGGWRLSTRSGHSRP